MSFNIKPTLYYILESPRNLAHNIYTSSKAFFNYFSFSRKAAEYTELQTIANYKALLYRYTPTYNKDNLSSVYISIMLDLYHEIINDLVINKEELIKEKFVYHKSEKEELLNKYSLKINRYYEKHINPLTERLQINVSKESDVFEEQNQKYFVLSKKYTDLETKYTSFMTDNLTIDTLNTTLKDVSIKHAQLEREMTELKQKITETIATNNTLLTQNTQLNEANTVLITRQSKDDQIIAQLKTTLENQKAEFDAQLKKTLENQKVELDVLKKKTLEFDALLKNYTSLSKQYTELYAYNTEVEKKYDALLVTHTDLKVVHSTLKNTVKMKQLGKIHIEHTVKDTVKDTKPPIKLSPISVGITPRNLTQQVTPVVNASVSSFSGEVNEEL